MNFRSRLQELNGAISSCIYTTHSKIPLSEDVALHSISQLISETCARKGIVYVIGNGGSAGIASHFSNDLMKALNIPSQTLYDSNLMTCLSNDLGYEHVFSYPLRQLLKPVDLLIAISSSGKSQNIIRAAEVALSHRTPLVTFSGFHVENPLRSMGQLNFWIDRSDYGLVETAHFFILHTIVDLWKKPTIEVPEHVYGNVQFK